MRNTLGAVDTWPNSPMINSKYDSTHSIGNYTAQLPRTQAVLNNQPKQGILSHQNHPWLTSIEIDILLKLSALKNLVQANNTTHPHKDKKTQLQHCTRASVGLDPS